MIRHVTRQAVLEPERILQRSETAVVGSCRKGNQLPVRKPKGSLGVPGVQQVRPGCAKCFLGVASVGMPKSVAYPNFARNMAKVWMVSPKSQPSVAKVCPVWPECGHDMKLIQGQ